MEQQGSAGRMAAAAQSWPCDRVLGYTEVILFRLAGPKVFP